MVSVLVLYVYQCMEENETGESVLLKLYYFTVVSRTKCFGNEVFIREPLYLIHYSV